MLRYLIEHGQVWVLEQRAVHRPDANPLNHDLRSTFEPYFGGEFLDLGYCMSCEREDFSVLIDFMSGGMK